MTHRHDIAIEQLKSIEESSKGSFEIINIKPNVLSYAYEVTVSVYCGNITCSDEGICLRDKERIVIRIPRDFPFRHPSVYVPHKRFAGHPHVQWQKHLCLFQAPESEWNPSDGMFGYIERLMTWLKKAAVDELDPEGVPLHPPVTYTKYSSPLVIPRTNTPTVNAVPWIGKAVLDFISDERMDIVGWCDALKGNGEKSGAAFLLSSEMPFEYPANVKDLLLKLEKSGVPRNLLLITMQLAILDNKEGDPLYVIVGSPMRGIAGNDQLKQHLAVWYIEPDVAKGLRLAVCKYSEDAQRRKIGEECEKIILEWAEKALIVWCKVREDRSEVTISRDSKSGLSWFKDKRVSLLGCGALGSHVAECLARAGVKQLVLYDNSVVAPGLLVRQLYEDGDIGKFKADALAKRLKKIYPAKTEFIIKICNILDDPLETEKFDREVDVLIDTTGNESVSKKLELVRKEIASPPHLASLCIGHNAVRAKAVLSLSNHSGGPLDVNRTTKLMLANKDLKDYLEEFWPKERRKPFQPEPGCSDITFTGSSADIAALSGLMLNSIAISLTKESDNSAFAFLFTQQHKGNNGYVNFEWKRDVILQDPHAGFEIRLECNAWREIESWCKTSKRCFGDRVETGGLLFGEVDELLHIIWATEVSGPPADSIQSEERFLCGINGVDELEDEKRERSRGSMGFVGMWHSHPSDMPLPSSEDYKGMHHLIVGRRNPSRGSLLLIVGTPYITPTIGSYYFKKEDFDERIHVRNCEVKESPLVTRDNDIGIALSGGGSRAIAFHLGCLRALNDRGILDQAKVISAVSGGSVIAAMYVFSQDSFENFDKKVVELLKRGVQGDIINQCMTLKHLLGALGTLTVSGSAAVVSHFAGRLFRAF